METDAELEHVSVALAAQEKMSNRLCDEVVLRRKHKKRLSFQIYNNDIVLRNI